MCALSAGCHISVLMLVWPAQYYRGLVLEMWVAVPLLASAALEIITAISAGNRTGSGEIPKTEVNPKTETNSKTAKLAVDFGVFSMQSLRALKPSLVAKP